MAHVNLPLEKLFARKDFNQRICLEFYRGNKWSECVIIEAGGPRKLRIQTEAVARKYYNILEKPLEDVAASLLKLHKAAHEPDEVLTDILTEVFIMATTKTAKLEEMGTKELLKVHNDLAEKLGKPTLKDWRSGKPKLLERIDALKADVKTKAKPAKKDAAQSTKPVKAKSEKGQGIGAFCIELLKAGKTNQDVLDAVKKKFPNANTSAASIAWYRNQINQGLK